MDLLASVGEVLGWLALALSAGSLVAIRLRGPDSLARGMIIMALALGAACVVARFAAGGP